MKAKGFDNADIDKKRFLELSIDRDIDDFSHDAIIEAQGALEGEVKGLRTIAESNLQASLPHVATEHYEGSHWLASFAIFALNQK